jgi:hypothetical protein
MINLTTRLINLVVADVTQELKLRSRKKEYSVFHSKAVFLSLDTVCRIMNSLRNNLPLKKEKTHSSRNSSDANSIPGIHRVEATRHAVSIAVSAPEKHSF